MGTEVLNLLFKLSCDITNGIPVLTPLAKANSFLAKSSTLPPGIAAMHETSGELTTINAYGSPDLVQCWGSDFKLNTNPTGFGIFVTGALLGAMQGIANDLVVPANSAVGFGAGQPLLDCSHTQYFQQLVVQQAIANFQVAAAPHVTLQSPLAFKTQVPGPQGG